VTPLPRVRIREDRLRNGTAVVTAAMPGHARCHVVVQLRGGPVHEDQHTWGLSHVVEHMVFRGADTLSDARAVSLAADDFGGDLGAATYRDRVTFDTRCDADRIDEALSLLARMLGRPRFAGLATELGVIEEEMAELYDDDGVEIDLDNIVFRQLFAGHRLARTIEATPRQLRRVTRAVLRRFHAAHYGPQHFVISVAGDVDHDDVVEAARRSFGRLPRGASLPSGTPPPRSATDARPVVVTRTDDAQTSLRLCLPCPGFGDDDAAIWSVVGRLLDDGPASRLQHEVIDRDGLAYAVWAMADFYEDRGLLELGGQVRHDRVVVLVDALVGQLERLMRRAPSRNELERVIARYTRDVRDTLDDPAALAEAIGKGVLFGRPFRPTEQIAAVAAVDGGDVRDAVRAAMPHACLALLGLPAARDVARLRQRIDRLRTDAPRGRTASRSAGKQKRAPLRGAR
jgi:predicted Zn-dependent peptidase